MENELEKYKEHGMDTGFMYVVRKIVGSIICQLRCDVVVSFARNLKFGVRLERNKQDPQVHISPPSLIGA